ncbi:PLC-like phosphodiesterase, TIM beta/alpha-barrel domain [Pseudocohnilembus persalinus]|uniref:PLC-like phosphodiesterase, TIM beta/alpha-barrel domain n=1 Tax=Pseudocohnilembus persalinus TaxID=266149 RepID=A0A0V0QWR1_PSEPJ|nr:PLC-like phosphodiesterase, TIM beta/alpha-barrel domain [Pseudocohnilembus persalinus]|eukprot:KRX06674.1 PLC-like phosphodiesterase, TIM beta/alpha-barrel domain [Pseudocohnilembus persalinus]
MHFKKEQIDIQSKINMNIKKKPFSSILTMGNSHVSQQHSKYISSEKQPRIYQQKWMENLDENQYISSFSIPGTHQSLSLHGEKFICTAKAQCQSWTLINQLNAGLSIDYNEYDQSDVEDVINEQSTKKTQKMKELRIFTHKMKEQWPLCHEYDHITPFSKGGETTVENCQILQTQVNRQKGNKDMTRSEMKLLSKKHTFTGEFIQKIIFQLLIIHAQYHIILVSQLDIIEAAVYGDIKQNNEQSINPIK